MVAYENTYLKLRIRLADQSQTAFLSRVVVSGEFRHKTRSMELRLQWDRARRQLRARLARMKITGAGSVSLRSYK